MSRLRVLLADDHRMVAEGLKSLLEPEFELVGLVEDGRRLLEEAARTKPDVALVDITMPRINGLEAIPLLKRAAPGLKVVVVTMHREPAYARRAFEAGADGFVLKHAAAEELIAAVRAAVEGKRPANAPVVSSQKISTPAPGGAGVLTVRQREIVELVAKGLTAKEIASVLGLSVRTVEFHKYRAMEAVGVSTSAELIRFALEHGLARP
jgi:DNA-binding NarL/FixJ family response regulator